MSAISQPKSQKLIGGWGPRARVAVVEVGRRAGMSTVQHGPLALAAPSGTLHEGVSGDVHVWLSGKVDVDDLESPPDGASIRTAQLAAVAFERLGRAAQGAIYGKYLLIALDESRKRAWVSHDHLGTRPLNYVRRGADVYFAEHIVDLLTLLPSTPAPDRVALVRWIDRQMLPLDRSLFAGIGRLPPGRGLELTENHLTVQPFWQPTFRDPEPRSASESAESIVAASYGAIKRAASDLERPAVKLSGGLDSACVAAGLAAASAGRPTLALSGTFPDYPDTDESHLLEQTAELTGLTLVKVPYADVPLIPGATAYVRQWMLPPASANHPIWERLMNEARALDVDGLLDGGGGDELFSVQPYLIADRLCSARPIAAWRLAGRLPGMGDRPSAKSRWIALRIYGISGSIPLPLQRLRRLFRERRAGIGPLVRDEDVPSIIGNDDTWAWKSGDGPSWWRAAVDGLVYGPHRLDATGDLARIGISAGLERRHPFIHDARLIEAVLAVPPEHQFDPARDRPLLRDGLRGAIPEPVRTRYAKSLFDGVITRPLSGAAGGALAAQLAAADAPVREYIRSEALEELMTIQTAPSPRRELLARRLFGLACVDAWLRCLGDRALREEAA